jgi:hypothetical protein
MCVATVSDGDIINIDSNLAANPLVVMCVVAVADGQVIHVGVDFGSEPTYGHVCGGRRGRPRKSRGSQLWH